jgi:hypothetical protein
MPLYINNENIPLYDLLRKPTSAKTCVYKNHANGKISTTKIMQPFLPLNKLYASASK